MKYIVTNKKFTRISETSGTIQNASRINTVEVSNQAVINTGVLLCPQEKFSFSELTLYARCTEIGGGAEIRVVPFLINFGATPSTPTQTDSDVATDTEADDIIEAAWSGDYSVSDPDAYNVVDETWNSSSYTDTGDGFSDYLDGLFPH